MYMELFQSTEFIMSFPSMKGGTPPPSNLLVVASQWEVKHMCWVDSVQPGGQPPPPVGYGGGP